MPIYEYACGACNSRFERLQKMSDPDPETCSQCGQAGQVKRQVSAPQFRLSGSGWYETDFKTDKDKKRNLSGEGGAPADPVAPTKTEAPAAASSDKSSGSPTAMPPTAP